jgi:hypothetical protein
MELLPSREQGLLLVACLAEDPAARAWLDYVAAVRDPKVYFEADQTGLKGLLPFVGSRLERNGINPGKAFQTYARVALVREALRSRIYGEILAAVLADLDAAHMSAMLLKGGALSATVYPQPSARHNHAIDLLVDEAQIESASALLSKAQFTPGPVTSGAAFHRNFRHSSGLALGLHSRLLFLPHFEMPLDDVRQRIQKIRIGGRPVCVMSPEDSLVHVCGHATYSRSRTNLRWACDAFYLLRRNPQLDWSLVIETAERSGLALPVFVLLRWAREALGAPIPSGRLSELHDCSRTIDAVTAEGIYASLLHSTLSRGRALRAFRISRRAQLGFLRFSALPSLRYMRWRHNVDQDWKLAAHYLDRPRRIVLRLAGRHAPVTQRKSARDQTGTSVKKGVA